MAKIPNPNDPYRPNPADDISNPAPFDSELQADPELTEGPASGSRMAVYALGIVVVLGAVFYGLNNTSMRPRRKRRRRRRTARRRLLPRPTISQTPIRSRRWPPACAT
jgi:hypothetical protein